MHLSDTCPSAIQLIEDDDSYCSAMDEAPLNIEDSWLSVDTASGLIDELSSCTDGKRLAMDAGAINCDTDLVDSTNSLTTNSILDEETNNRINTNCHLHHWGKQSITDDLHAVTLFQACGHLTVCEICTNEALLCPICNEIVMDRLRCRVVLLLCDNFQ